MGLQEQHDLPNLLLFVPGRSDHGDPFLSDTLDLGQLLQFIFDDIESFTAEPLDDSLGHDRADALNETGAQVSLDAIDRGWDLRFEIQHLELPAVSGMIGPLTLHQEDFSRRDSHQVSHHGR